MLIDLDRRSAEENKYYWSVVVAALARIWRTSKTSAHERVKDQFLEGASTATLNTVQFEQLMDRLRAYALARHRIQIPPPYSSGGPENELLS